MNLPMGIYSVLEKYRKRKKQMRDECDFFAVSSCCDHPCHEMEWENKIKINKKKIFIKFPSNDRKLKKKRNFHHYECEGGTCFEHNLNVYIYIDLYGNKLQ
ncbi:hypothetical protein ACKWTF_002658 [Chironomus riparius]